MAKVLIEDGWLEVRVGLLERLLLSERPRKVPLSRICSVNPRPELVDMLLHWTSQSGVWLSGATPYEGYLVPSARNPAATLAIEIAGEGNVFIELDDEEPVVVARRIEHLRQSIPPELRALASDEGAALATRSRRSAEKNRKLSKLGGWLVAGGVLGLAAGAVSAIAGVLPGLLAVGAGLVCALMGALTLRLVAHQH
jgi:hypothetical protein